MSNLTVKVIGKNKKVELPSAFFGQMVRIPLIHQVVVAQQAAARQGTHATKTRAMVSGTGAKPWRQKGTGRARHGDLIAPQFTGGGVAHGPQPRSYAQRTPKKMIRAALLGALSDRANEALVFVVEKLVSGKQPSTKDALKTLAKVGEYRRYLLVLDPADQLSFMSARNISNVHVLSYDQLNAYDVLLADAVVFTTEALEKFTATAQPEAQAEEDADE